MKSGRKWQKVAESGRKWQKVAESGRKWQKWQKVAFEKWQKVAFYNPVYQNPKTVFTFSNFQRKDNLYISYS